METEEVKGFDLEPVEQMFAPELVGQIKESLERNVSKLEVDSEKLVESRRAMTDRHLEEVEKTLKRHLEEIREHNSDAAVSPLRELRDTCVNAAEFFEQISGTRIVVPELPRVLFPSRISTMEDGRGNRERTNEIAEILASHPEGLTVARIAQLHDPEAKGTDLKKLKNRTQGSLNYGKKNGRFVSKKVNETRNLWSLAEDND